jgi:hypothetical protein
LQRSFGEAEFQSHSFLARPYHAIATMITFANGDLMSGRVTKAKENTEKSAEFYDKV